MKYIVKGAAPRKYLDWCKAVKGKENEDYRRVHSDERGPLKDALIDEQGSLCAYTMRRIDKDSCHVEHIKPETLCRAELRGSDLDYSNMLACFPKEGMKAAYRYGAQVKGKWWDEGGKAFISPLDPRCEILITFKLNGEILPNNNDPRAKKTIEILKLDHASLTEDRKRAIEEFIYGPSGDSPVTKAKALQAIEEITKRRRGKFFEFCIAIKYALKEHIVRLDKAAAKQKFAAQQAKKK